MTIGISSVDLPSACVPSAAWLPPHSCTVPRPAPGRGAVRGREVLKKAGAGFLFLNQMSELCHVGCGIWKQKILQTLGLSAATGQGMSTCLITKCIYAYQTSPYIHTPYMVASGQKQTNKQVHQVEIHERAPPVQYTPWHSSSLQTCGSWSFHGKQKTTRRSWNL